MGYLLRRACARDSKRHNPFLDSIFQCGGLGLGLAWVCQSLYIYINKYIYINIWEGVPPGSYLALAFLALATIALSGRGQELRFETREAKKSA
jgi:hypothetical protein